MTVQLTIYGEAVELTESQLRQLANNEQATDVLQDAHYYLDVCIEGARQLAMQGGNYALIVQLLDVAQQKLPWFVE